jgi:hypothetical protein
VANWLFTDPPDTAVITVRNIVYEGRPILHVSHDIEDGMWQFLDGDLVSMEDALVVSLVEIVQLDDSIIELANLPLGWEASRSKIGDTWVRRSGANS